MALITIIISLALEMFMQQLHALRRYNWFLSYSSRILGLFRESSSWSGPLAVISVLALPLLITGILDSFLSERLFGLPGMVFAIMILAYCLRFQSMDKALDQYLDAQANGEQELAQSAANDLLDQDLPYQPESEEVTEAILLQSNERMFAVLFWFIILGPLGALMYRLAWALSNRLQTQEFATIGFIEASTRLHGILAWPPARLLSATFALAGSFEGVLGAWREYYQTHTENIIDANRDLLLRTGKAAINHQAFTSGVQTEADTNLALESVNSARGLILRSLLVWCTVIALITLVGWVS